MKEIIIPSKEKKVPNALFVPPMVIPPNALKAFIQHYGKDNLLGFLPAYVDENAVKQFNTPYLTLKTDSIAEKKIENSQNVIEQIKEIEKEIKQHKNG